MKIVLWMTIAAALSIAAVSSQATSTSKYLSEDDKAKARAIVDAGFSLEDVPSVHYAVLAYKLTDTKIPKTAEICKYLLTTAGDGNNLTPENAYYITSTWNTLAACQPLPIVTLSKKLTAIVEQDTTSVPDLYHAISSLTALSQKLLPATIERVAKNLQAALNKDSPINTAYSFHIAAEIGTAGSFALGNIKDVIAQADEVNGHSLQFEAGLSVTSLMINGIYRLSANLKTKPPITSQQVAKFANYFLSRSIVQSPKGVVSYLSSIKVLATNDFEKPVCIALANKGVVSSKQSLLEVKVCDILGNPLPSIPGVIADSVKTEGNVEISNKKLPFQPSSSDKTLFTLNLAELKLEGGFYDVSVSAASWKNVVAVKVVSEITVDYLDIGTADADQTTQPKLERVAYPKTHGEMIKADYQQKLVIRFLLKDSANKAARVHQAFVRLTWVDAKPGEDNGVIFVAEPDASHVYKFDMPVGAEAKNFNSQNGVYNVELIIGDALLENSFQWKVGSTELKFPGQATSKDAAKATYVQKANIYAPQPEIQHMFREPEKRPPAFVSTLFTGLCLAPVMLLLIIWAKLGANISNFPLSLSAIAFHGGLAGIFVLFGIFWLRLDMFVTLRYLLGLGVVTFFAGNKLLSHVARTHKVSSK